MNRIHGIRIQEFRQLRKEIRGSDQHLIVGIDVAKERHNAFFGTATGRTLHKGMVFDNTIEGFRKLLTVTEALKVQHDLTRVVFGLEPTANYHKPLGEHLIKCGPVGFSIGNCSKEQPASSGWQMGQARHKRFRQCG